MISKMGKTLTLAGDQALLKEKVAKTEDSKETHTVTGADRQLRKATAAKQRRRDRRQN